MSPLRALAGALAVLSLAAGCGYTIGIAGTLPPHIKTVAVPIFTNSTQEPAVENVITAAVVNAFSTSGRLRVVSVNSADAILQGQITGYTLDSIAFNSQINVTEYRLRVRLNITFRDVRQNTVLWKEDGLEEQANFRVEGRVSDSIAREGAAARQAAVLIGRRIVSAAVDRF
jgi:outer membrane lipopolysaccharide assembly protein LptE/RlpB